MQHLWPVAIIKRLKLSLMEIKTWTEKQSNFHCQGPCYCCNLADKLCADNVTWGPIYHIQLQHVYLVDSCYWTCFANAIAHRILKCTSSCLMIYFKLLSLFILRIVQQSWRETIKLYDLILLNYYYLSLSSLPFL